MSDFALNIGLGATAFVKKNNEAKRLLAEAEKERILKQKIELETYEKKKVIDHMMKINPAGIEATVDADAYRLSLVETSGGPETEGRIESRKETAQQIENINFLDRIVEGTNLTNREIIAQSKAEDIRGDIEAGIPILSGATTGLTDMAKEAVSLGLPAHATADQIRERRDFFARLTEIEKRAFNVGLPINSPMDDIVKAENEADANKQITIANIIRGTIADPELEYKRKEDAMRIVDAENWITQLTQEGFYHDGTSPVIGAKVGVVGVLDPLEQKQAVNDFLSSQLGGVRIKVDKQQIMKYNTWAKRTANKQINPDLPYILLRTKDDPKYKNRDPKNVTVELINQYRAIPNEVYASMNPHKKGMIDRKLERQLNNLWLEHNVFEFTETGGKMISKTQNFNWDAVGIDWNNLPPWVHRKATKLINSRVPDPTNVVKMVTQEDGTTEIEVSSTEISKDNVIQIEENVPNSPLSMEQAAVLLHAKDSGYLSYSVIMGDDSERKIANTYISDSPISVMGNMILHTLFYKTNTGLIPRTVPLEGQRRDAILAQANDFAVKTSIENKPDVVGMKFSPRKYHETKLDMFSASINSTYIIQELKRQRRLGGLSTSPDFVVVEGEVLNQAFIEEAYGIDVKATRDATTFSDPAYSTGVALIKSLDETGIGSSLSELLVIIRSGMTTLPSEITRALGDWVANNDENESTYSNINARNVLNSALNTDVRGITQTYKGENATRLRGTIDTVLTAANKYNNDAQGTPLGAKIAKQKMLHSALVFYTAAAFQGEGGKAISDGDRKFVEWALGYGMFSNVEMRQAAVMGMLQIIAKADTINKYMSSGDPKKMFVAANYNQIHGENSISPEDWKLTGIPNGAYTNQNAPRLVDFDVIKRSHETVTFTDISRKSSGLGTNISPEGTGGKDIQSSFESFSVPVTGGSVVISDNMSKKEVDNIKAQLEEVQTEEAKNALDILNKHYK